MQANLLLVYSKDRLDQAHSNINPDKSIWENFCDGQELIMMEGVK
jgi:hypothetical protein